MNSTLWNTYEEALGHFILGGASLFVHAYAIFICYAISDYQGLFCHILSNHIITFAYLLTVLYLHLCVHHVNFAGSCWFGRFLNVYLLLFVFCWIKKKGESVWKFCDEITQAFLNLKVPKQAFFQSIIENKTAKVIWTFNTQSKWHDPHIAGEGVQIYLHNIWMVPKMKSLMMKRVHLIFLQKIWCWCNFVYCTINL